MSLLPLSLLRAAQRQPMLVELKNGDTYNGNLVGSDNFMNLALKDVTITSKDGQKFWSQPEVFVRGLAIKYIRAWGLGRLRVACGSSSAGLLLPLLPLQPE